MSERESSLSVGLTNVESLAKGLAVLTAVALCTGFLYDAIFFARLDHRLIGLLVMSDHVETAISVVPFVLLAALILWAQPYLSRGLEVGGVEWTWPFFLKIIVLIAFLVAIVWFVSTTGPSGSSAAQLPSLALAAAVLLLGFLLPSKYRLGRVAFPFPDVSADDGKRSLILWATGVWIIFTVWNAVVQAGTIRKDLFRIDDVAFADLVWLEDRSVVAGQVVRVIDRGLIVATRQDSLHFLFIPREKVWRVELR